MIWSGSRGGKGSCLTQRIEKLKLKKRSISPSAWEDVVVEPSRRKTAMSTALTKPQIVASWPNVCDFILLEHSWSPWGLQLSISLLWLKKERRHMQTSTEIMIPWKILRRWGRLVPFRVQSNLEYKEFLWVELLGSLSFSCVPELWNYDYLGWEIVSQ